MEFRVLGPIQAIDQGCTLALGSPKQRALLALLLIHRNEVLAAERIVDALWGEEARPGTRKTLHVYVAGLRKVLEPGRRAGSPPQTLLTRPPGYVLRAAASELDAADFEERVSDAESRVASDSGQAAEELRAALALWRGRPYEDVAYEAFAQGEIRRLEELRLRGQELANDAELRLGRHGALVGSLEALVEEHPQHEPFWAQLMLALYRSGRQPDALRAYRRARDACTEVGTAPSADLDRLETQILLRDPDLDQTNHATAVDGNLPAPLSSFVGRSADTTRVRQWVGAHRLVTLSGPGGVGKSRLAIEAARGLGAEFRHGVWLAELAGVSSGDEVAPNVSRVLGVPGGAGHTDIVDGLVEYIANRNLLLLLDNCEHLTEALTELVHTMLTCCPRLRVLATSRRPLGVEGEVVVPIGPMDVDAGPDGEPPDAVRLFLDRADLVRPTIAAGPDATPLAIEVCLRLAGLPLAIELAAARLRVMSLEELARRCAEDITLLNGGPTRPVAHHRAMRATLDWSYQLLEPAEQALFRRLAVFRGGFTLDAAREFHARLPENEGDPVHLVADLVDASMITLASGDRYTLLEPVRRYGSWLLASCGEEAAARRAHATVFVEMFRVPESVLFHPSNSVPGILERFEPEIDNVSAALSWAFSSGQVDAAVELTSVAGLLLQARRPMREGQRWLRRALAASSKPTPARARALAQACLNALHVDGMPEAARLVDELAGTAEALDDERWRAAAIVRRADLAHFAADSETAARLYDEAIARLDRLDNPGVCVALNNYADMLATVGRFDDAERVSHRMVAAAKMFGSPPSERLARLHLAYLATCRCDAVAARRHLCALEFPMEADYEAIIRCHLALLDNDLDEAERLAWTALANGRESNHQEQLCASLILVGLVQLGKGDPGAACLFLSEALREPTRLRDVLLRHDVLAPLAAAWAELDPARGAALLSAVATSNRRKRRALPCLIARMVDGATRSVRNILEPDELEEAWERGASLTLDEAIALALEYSGGRLAEGGCAQGAGSPALGSQPVV